MARSGGRRMAMAAAALATAAAPFVLGQQAASAAVILDEEQTSSTFVTRAGTTVTCTFYVYTTHNTDVRTLNAYNQTRRSDGERVPECDGTQHLHVVYKDGEGDQNTLQGVGYDTGDTEVFVQEVRSHVSTTHNVFFTQCDLNVAQDCDLTFQTAAK